MKASAREHDASSRLSFYGKAYDIAVQNARRSYPVSVGWIISRLTMGGVTRGILTTMRHADLRKIIWQGIAAQFPADPAIRACAELKLYCPYLRDGTGEFQRDVQELVNRSDILMLWGDFSQAGHDALRRVDWKGKSVVVRSHGTCGWTRRMLSRLHPYGTHFMAVSEAAARKFPSGLHGMVKVLYNGVDLGRTAPTRTRAEIRKQWGLREDEIAVGYYGRCSPEKNPLAAAQAVRRLGPPYRSVCIGKQWFDEPVPAELRLVDPSAVVVEEQDQIGNVLAALDVFVLASYTEGHAQCLIECWQAGLPVAATPVGAVPELEKKYGPLTARIPLNPRPVHLAAAVRAALSPSHRTTIENARKLARSEFTGTGMASRFEALIDDVLHTPKAVRRPPRRPLRAAFVVDALWVGGAERWIASLIKNTEPGRIQWNGVAVTSRLGADEAVCNEIAWCTPLHGVRAGPRDPDIGFPDKSFTKLHEDPRQAVREVARDVDLFISWGTPEIFEHVKEYGKPLVLVSHETTSFKGVERWPVHKNIHLAAVSEDAKEFYFHREGAQGKPIEVIWNGAEEKRCSPRLGRDVQRRLWGVSEDERVIGYLGRQAEEKNYLAAARALSELPAEYRAIYYGYCVHTGAPASARLRAAMKGKPGRIQAFPSEIYVGDVLAGFDCLMSVSHRESFGLSMIEAWMAGTPTITTPTCIPKDFNRRFGPLTIIVPFDPSPRMLAEAVERAAGPEGREMAERAKCVAFEHLTAEKMAMCWTNYFEKVARRTPRRLISAPS